MLILFDTPIEKSLAPFIYTFYTRPPPVGGGTSTSAVVDEPKEEAEEINALNSSVKTDRPVDDRCLVPFLECIR